MIYPLVNQAVTYDTLRHISRNLQVMRTAQSRITTGRRVNSPADNPAAYAMALRVRVDIGVLEALRLNVGLGLAITNTSRIGAEKVEALLTEARALALKAQGEGYTAEQLEAMQQQLAGLIRQVDSLSAAATYNGVNLLRPRYSPNTEILPSYEVVTYVSENQDGSKEGVFAQRLDATGQVIGSEIQVNAYTAGDQQAPAVTVLADGGFVVTYQSKGQDSSGYGIFARVFDAEGQALGGEFLVNQITTGDQLNPMVTALDTGGFVVSYTSDDSNKTGVYARQFDRQGIALGNEILVNTVERGNQEHASITALKEGGFVVAYESVHETSKQEGVALQRYDALGQALGGEQFLTNPEGWEQFLPVVTALQDGGYVVTYEAKQKSSQIINSYAQVFDADGNGQGSAFLVNEGHWGTEMDPQVVQLDNGTLAFSYTGTLDGEDVYVRLFDTAGNALSGSLLVHNQSVGDQLDSQITALQDGGFMVTYTGEDTDREGVFARRFDDQGTAQGVEFLVNQTTADGQKASSVMAKASIHNLTILVTKDGGHISVKNKDISTNALGLYGLDLIDNPQGALHAIEAAMDTVNSVSVSLGSAVKQFETQQKLNDATIAVYTEGVGALVNADLATESAVLMAAQIRDELAMQMLSIVNCQSTPLLMLFDLNQQEAFGSAPF